MRVLNLGLRTTQQTTLFVKMPAADSTAILRIGTADNFATVAFQGDTASTTLPANDYVVALDSALVPSSSGTAFTLDSRTFVDLKLVTSLPPGYEQATDVLKVIGTLEHADFEWLTLRPLDQPYGGSALTEPKRTTRAPKIPFEDLMALMHEPPHGQRQVTLSASPTFGWTEAQVGLVVQR